MSWTKMAQNLLSLLIYTPVIIRQKLSASARSQDSKIEEALGFIEEPGAFSFLHPFFGICGKTGVI